MSKVVKKIGRGVGKVVSGIGKVIKKVTSSKAFKTIAIAAAVYFTGGAALGAMGGASAASAAGTSVLSGAASGTMAGLGSAGAGISSAWGSLMGGSISGVGSSLAGGLTGAGSAGAGAVGGGFTSALSSGYGATSGLLNPAAATATQGATTFAANAPTQLGRAAIGATETGAGAIGSMPVGELMKLPMTELQAASGSLSAGQIAELGKAGIKLAPEVAKKGLLRSAMSNPLVQYGAMQTGGRMISGYANGRAQEEAVRDNAAEIDRKEREDRERYQTNMGTKLWDSKY